MTCTSLLDCRAFGPAFFVERRLNIVFSGYVGSVGFYESKAGLVKVVIPKLVSFTLSIWVLAACSEPGLFSQSRMEEERRKIDDRNTFSYVVANPETDTSFDGTLKEAVFELTRDMTAEQAIALFESDGAICENRVCIWEAQRRETWAEMNLGVRQPGPRRNFNHFRRVTLVSENVTSPTDIVITHRTDISTNGNKKTPLASAVE